MAHAHDAVEFSSGSPTTPSRAQRWLARLAVLGGSPRRTAAAFAFGVFLSFSPLLGLQIVVGLGVALALRLSRAAVLIGLCMNLPWITMPWYALTTAAGALVLGVPLGTDFGARVAQVFAVPVYQSVFWQRAVELAGPFLLPFALGSTAGAILIGLLAYFTTARLLTTLPCAPRTAASCRSACPSPEARALRNGPSPSAHR